MKNLAHPLFWKKHLLLLLIATIVWSLFYATGHHFWNLTIQQHPWRYHGLFLALTYILAWLPTTSFFAPVEKKGKSPAWFYRWGRTIIGWWLLTIPFLYDNGVPEVGGDLRWSVTHVTVLVLCVLGAGALWKRKTPLALKPYAPLIVWCFGGLILTASISFVDTLNPYRSWWFYKHFLSFIGIAGFIYVLRNPRWYKTLFWLVILPVGPISMLAICQFMDFSDAHIANLVGSWWTLLWRPLDVLRATYPQAAIPGGTFSNKNLLASYIIMLWPLLMFALITAKTWKVRALSSIWLSCAMVALIFTRARASWLAFVVALIFLTVWSLSQKSIRQELKKYATKATGLALIAIVGVLVYTYPTVSPLKTTYAINISVAQQAKNITNITDYGPRIAYNLNGLKMIADNPFTGVGIGAFHTAYPRYHNAFYPTPKNGYNVEARPQRTHNDLLQAFIEQGVFGGLLHIAVIVLIITAAWRLSQSAPHPRLRLLATFMATGIVAFGFNAMEDFPLQMPMAPAMLFTLFGIMAGYARLEKQLPSTGWPEYQLTLPRAIWGVLTLILMGTTLFIVQDNYNRRMSAMYLKKAMSRNMSHLFDDESLNYINKAFNTYSWNARLQEYRGINYALYNGTHHMPNEVRRQALLQAMKHDPYAANHKVNMANLLQRMSDQEMKLGNKANRTQYQKEIGKILQDLLIVAPNSIHTWNIKALWELNQGRMKDAVQSYFHTLEIDPNNPTARIMLQRIQDLQQPQATSATSVPQPSSK